MATRLGTAAEAVEQARDELAPDAFPPILDGETQVRVAPRSRHRHGRFAVPQRVRDQVREHPVERDRVHRRFEIGRDSDLHFFLRSSRDRVNELLDLRTETQEFGRDLDRSQVEAGEVEQLLDQASHPRRLCPKRVPQRQAVRLGQCIAPLVQGDAKAVDARQRVPQLVGGERDELALQHVEPLRLLACESALKESRDDNAYGRKRLHLGSVWRGCPA